MMEYIYNHLPGFWVTFGFTLLAIEVLLFGFTTIIFLFAGIGAVATGLLMMSGLLPETWIAGVACFGLSTGISSALLWVPLKKMQDKGGDDRKPESDLVGLEFRLAGDITATKAGSYRYSGIDWKIEIDRSSGLESVSKGDRVQVVSVDVGIFRVKEAD